MTVRRSTRPTPPVRRLKTSIGPSSIESWRRAAGTADVPLRILHAASFLEPCLELAGMDALDGLQVADGADVGRRHFPPLSPYPPALLPPVYSRLVASDLKLTLLAQYPPQHVVLVLDAAGTPEARVDSVPLAELDPEERFSTP